MLNTRASLLSIMLMLFIGMVNSIDLSAQDNKDVFESYKLLIESKFNSTRAHQDKIFSNFRDSINKAFSTFLLKEWDQATMSEYIPNPNKPEPKPIIDTSKVISSTPLPHIEPLPEPPIVAATPIILPPSDVKPAITPTHPDSPINNNESIQNENLFTFEFYGAICKVNLPNKKELKLQSSSRKEISRVWEILSSEAYDNFLKDCINYKDSLQLCDWGVYQFIESVSKSYLENVDSNESVLFQMYALSQLGYKARLGMQGNRLINLVAFNQQIYSKPYLLIDGQEFYFLSSGLKEDGIQLCDFKFPNEQGASLRMNTMPRFPYAPSTKRSIKSTAYPNAHASVSVNNNLIEFLSTYPNCSWELFAEASLSDEVKKQLYPILSRITSSLSEKDAANVLLNFVQTGFEYKTDDEQFGREKTFFGDEPFYYPYCDCEDRSILYAILIKDLLKLDVVLLDYPSHIATAVCFTENITGDYFKIDEKKYIICDPTYIGAPIGKSMPDLLNIKAKILRVQ